MSVERSPRSSMDSSRSSSPAPSIHSEPDLLPPAVSGPMAWEGSDLNPLEYVIHLIADEIAQIRSALISFKLTGKPRGEISKQTFPLSDQFAKKLVGISNELHNGIGVVILRGLHEANLNDEESVIAFAGICSYICELRATDEFANQTLSHVRDATHDVVPDFAKDIGLAGSKITDKMDFHSDRFSGDILALHVRDDGGVGSGGEQYISSSWRIYNELLNTDPEVLEALATPDWPFELKQKDTAPYLELGPILFFSKGRPIVQLVKAPLIGSPRIPRDVSMPKLSAKQQYAIEVVERLAKQFCTKLDRQTGDIQLINNLSIMHARSAYGNQSQRSTRHLLRMFLRDPANAWEKPPTCRTNFDNPFIHGRPQELSILDLDPWRKISGRESHG